jgi:hypothetical protein
MTPSMIQTTGPCSESLPRATRERFEDPLRRRQAMRRSVIAALALTLAALALIVSITVGTHLVAAWWLERLHCAVVWEMDNNNWRQGGVTRVYHSTRSWGWSDLGNADLNRLKRLHRVVSLDLAEADKITNKGLAALRGLVDLSELNLDRSERFRLAAFRAQVPPLTDACVVHLQALPRLENLTLAGNSITDQGLSQIAKMANLKFLDLNATEVSDVGLAELEGMKSLKTVNLGATRVTSAGVAKLQQARPDLTIELDIDPAVEHEVTLRRGATP